MKNFNEWLYERDQHLAENMWGPLPARSRKPTDGWPKKASLSANRSMSGGASPMAGPAMGAKMNAKMKK